MQREKCAVVTTLELVVTTVESVRDSKSERRQRDAIRGSQQGSMFSLKAALALSRI